MSATAKELQVLELPKTGALNYEKTQDRLKPLPNGRPIAANTSDGIDALLGYLD